VAGNVGLTYKVFWELYVEIDWLEFNVPFQQKYGYIRDERSGVESYSYPVKEGQRYINLNPGRLFVQHPPKEGKGSRGSFTLLHQRLQQGETTITSQDKTKSNTTKASMHP